MMELLKKYKNIFLIIAVVIVGVLLYFYVFKKDEPLTTTSNTSTAELFGQDLIAELNRLKSLRDINTSIFTSASFSNLQDITVPITPRPIGKDNPFL